MVENGPTIHLIGAQETNYPWGFENRLIPALEAIGCTVISTDFRKNRGDLPRLLRQPAELLLVCKGEGIPPEVIQSAPCTTVLWYAEQIGTLDRVDPTAQQHRRELAFNGPAFDYVFSHDATNLNVYRQLGCTRVGWLPTAAVDPSIHRRLDLSKEYDVVFVGSRTPRRERFLHELERHIPVYAPQVWDMEELNRLFNRSRIVLNLHLSDLLNTETRLCEVTGAGAFLLTETPSVPDFLEDGKHVVFFTPGDVDDCLAKIEYYLAHEEDRETIAAAGYAHVHNDGHTYEARLRTMLASVDLSLKRRVWAGAELGVPRDKWGQPTARLADFYSAVEQQLFQEGVPIAPINAAYIGKADDLEPFYDAALKKLEVEFALRWADQRVQHSGWSVSKRALSLLMDNLPEGIEGVVEFGAGYSTLFLAKLFEVRRKPLKIVSFEHQGVFFDRLKSHVSPFPNVRLFRAELKQLSDQEYEALFSSDQPVRSYKGMGMPVPKELYSQTRLHNVFYDVDLSEQIQGKVDLVILDGPNSNGRSIVFPLVQDVAKTPFYCFVDDITHHPYMEQMSRVFNYEMAFEENFGHDAYCLVRVESVKRRP